VDPLVLLILVFYCINSDTGGLSSLMANVQFKSAVNVPGIKGGSVSALSWFWFLYFSSLSEEAAV
ncbi:uncharacterized protein METZ01_LOCUS352442, partial [marine metagenome]